TDAFQKEYISSTLSKQSGNWAATARELGLHRSNLHQLAKRLKMK
ncbi:MAG: hypothetical protein HQL32_10425, partial [Planctomycetes bacterium]|nr:hypothetical protein [Planctomycetota bacterium]